jgi:3-hydroxyacyl-CoA dehydrogenase
VTSELKQIAVVGAGSIGVSWAVVFARAGHSVAMHDPDGARRASAEHELRDRLVELEGAELLGEAAAQVADRVTLHAELDAAIAGAAHVQECAPEDLELKQALFQRLDHKTAPDTVLASSSSAITISELAAALPGRSRCLIVHPANPPHLLPVVELVPAPFTDESVLATTTTLLESAGMAPVRVRREVEGFIYNRLQGAVLREAYCLVRDGVATVDDIDRVMRDGLGRRWAVVGPFETVDLNTRGGIDVHANRMGPAYARMGAERGQDDPWTAELVEKVVAARRNLLPLAEWEDRVRWRDQMLMEFERTRRELQIDA